MATDPFIHHLGLCESESVGSGTRVWAFAHVLPGAVVGKDCNICDGAFIESGVVIGNRVTVKNGVMIFAGARVGDDVFLGPGVVFTNDLYPRSRYREGIDHLRGIEVKRGATIGANATIVCGYQIGEFSFVGAGAVVAADVPAYALMLGNPARQTGWVCRCGHRLDDRYTCLNCGNAYRLEGEALTNKDAGEPS